MEVFEEIHEDLTRWNEVFDAWNTEINRCDPIPLRLMVLSALADITYLSRCRSGSRRERRRAEQDVQVAVQDLVDASNAGLICSRRVLALCDILRHLDADSVCSDTERQQQQLTATQQHQNTATQTRREDSTHPFSPDRAEFIVSAQELHEHVLTMIDRIDQLVLVANNALRVGVGNARFERGPTAERSFNKRGQNGKSTAEMLTPTKCPV